MTDLLSVAALATLAAPLALFAVLGLFGLAGRSLSESRIETMTRASFLLATVASFSMAACLAVTGEETVRVHLGAWYALPGHPVELTLLVDRLSVPFAMLTALLLGVVGSFSNRYMHRESSYDRFFLLLALFASGMMLVVLAGSADMALAGWEMVGMSSALLVGFFHHRPAPVRNALRVFIVYRLCDVGLVAGTILLHHTAGHGRLGLVTVQPAAHATTVALLFALAAMGKSAQIPFSGWLPRAMEGPTPSSAIFYGALSVHLGPYLLLRSAPLLDQSPVACAAIVAMGALTAVLAALAGRVQTDVKSSLAYASLTQVGVVFVEIGLGFRYLPLAHMIGHALIRSLQILRAPSLLHDVHEVEAAVGGHLPRAGLGLELAVPEPSRRRLYGLALERFFLDELLEAIVARPLHRLFLAADALERRWVAWLGGLGR